MPMYEYACGECGTHMEVRQRISEDPLTTCPRCETDTLQRLVSMSSFALKGGGWYADGYGNAEKSDATATDAKSKSDGDAKKAEKTEKKTESKSADSGSSPKAAANG
jgi:putative FmdB family regulatory protein